MTRRRQSSGDCRGVNMMDSGPGSVTLFDPPKALPPKAPFVDPHALDRQITDKVLDHHYRKRILCEDVEPLLIKRAQADHFRGPYKKS